LEIAAPIVKDDLVEKCKQGDRKSYAVLYEKYCKAMYHTSLRIVNNEGDAEDILQEAFVDAFKSLESFQYRSTFGAWLKRIVINKSINHLRKRKMEFIDLDKTQVGDLPQEEAMDEQHIQWRVDEIKKAMKLLPNGYRTVLSLHLFDGFGQEEIAGMLNVTHTTVRTQYIRAKQKLISIIKQGGAL
jgi:RNA polymerase sigma factor (sigma-70 family)